MPGSFENLPLPVIPVVDLRGGQIVHAVAGERRHYRPVSGPWFRSSQPQDVAAGLRDALLSSGNATQGDHAPAVPTGSAVTMYGADLDGILDGRPDWPVWERLVQSGTSHAAPTRWMIDAGLSRLDDVRRLVDLGADAVLALESCPGFEWMEECVRFLGTKRLLFSLDLRDGRPLTEHPAWKSQPPDELAAAAVSAGISRLIVLDLAGVGRGQGIPTLEILVRLRKRWPRLELVTGGGVRNWSDLQAARAAGADGALVATALHLGTIWQSEGESHRNIYIVDSTARS